MWRPFQRITRAYRVSHFRRSKVDADSVNTMLKTYENSYKQQKRSHDSPFKFYLVPNIIYYSILVWINVALYGFWNIPLYKALCTVTGEQRSEEEF
mmetsp:Transcript_2422/g.3524  ORF Transcript_2422/g.3524 Transcript_2422/m.3524 type:complete len:96 (-) Transcript_2422:2117-2404(-)